MISVGERRSLVVASQCEALNRLSFLPDAGQEVSGTLLDPEIGGCVPALADGRGLLVDPTMVELDDALVEAFERASEDEATLFLSLVGHGEYAEDDFYFLTKDTSLPVDSRRSFLFAQRIKELLGRYSMLDGLVVLLDTCHAGIGAMQAGQRWLRIVGEAGKRFDLLTASDNRAAANGCFSRSLVTVLRSGHTTFGERVRCADLKRVIAGLCPLQTAVHLGFDGTREVAEADQGLWLALNSSPAWRRSPLAGNPAAPDIERLTANYRPSPLLGETVGHLLTGARTVAIAGAEGSGKSTMLAALARPSVAGSYVPPDFLHAVLFATRGQTAELLARELAGQLRRSVPGFEDAERAYLDTLDDAGRSGASAFDLALLGPLRTLAPQWTDGHVRIAVDGVDDLEPGLRERLTGLLRDLAASAELSWVKTVVATRDPGDLPAAVTVRLSPGAPKPPTMRPGAQHPGSFPGQQPPQQSSPWPAADPPSNPADPLPATLIIDVPGHTVVNHELALGGTTLGRSRRAGLRLADSRVSRLHCEIRWDGSTAWLTDLDSANGTLVNGHRKLNALLSSRDVIRIGDSTVTFISVALENGPPDWAAPADEATGSTASPEPERSVLLDLLQLAAARGPIPISILTAASASSGGPSRTVHVRDTLAALGSEVTRTRAGLPDETVLWKAGRPAVPASAAARLHSRLAAAAGEVSPVSGDEEPTPEQVYATANESEYLWLAGLYDDALSALERRASDIPVENRERWAAWANRAARILGETHRITLRCKARHATWTGKAGDAAGALARFRELLPIATAELGEGDEEVLSVRNNIGHSLLDLGRFEDSQEEFAALVRDSTQALGEDHRETLHARHLFAVATGKTDGAESLRLARELLPHAKHVLGDDEIVRHIRHNIAFWSAEIDAPPPAVSEYRRLLAEARGRLNDRHPDLLDLRFGFALVLAKAGQVTEALSTLSSLLDDSLEVRGERHEETRKIQEQLEYWGSRE